MRPMISPEGDDFHMSFLYGMLKVILTQSRRVAEKRLCTTSASPRLCVRLRHTQPGAAMRPMISPKVMIFM